MRKLRRLKGDYPMTTYTFNEFYIPSRMMPSLLDYIENGATPGGFLTAVICNDLKEAVGRADTENLRNLPAFVGYLYNEAPSMCWGSEERMKDWIATRRLNDLQTLR